MSDAPTIDWLPAALRHDAGTCSFEAGSTVVRQGAVPRHVYGVLEGELRLVRAGRDGELLILQRVRHGWVAEASLFAPRYHCDLVAGCATRCIRVPVPAMREAFAHSPAFARDWAMGLSAEVRRLRGACERLGLRSAQQRVIHAIESEGTEGRLRSGTLKDWAAELGLTHEALYRTLARMEAAGILRKEQGSLQLVAPVRSRPADPLQKTPQGR